jgi:hypothetical protein
MALDQVHKKRTIRHEMRNKGEAAGVRVDGPATKVAKKSWCWQVLQLGDFGPL